MWDGPALGEADVEAEAAVEAALEAELCPDEPGWVGRPAAQPASSTIETSTR